jgi:GABA(A) receptor-associated protein
MFTTKGQHYFKFDKEYSLEQRKIESSRILSKYPDRVPLIVEPTSGCDIEIDKKKYLVPRDLSIGQFLFVIRKRLKMPAEKALFIFVGSTVPASSTFISELYERHVSEDGFLKLTFSEENVFG